jgi:hypothetical protein
MELMRNDWTDSRLDDFAVHVDQRFDRLEWRVDDGFRETRAEFVALRAEMNARFEKVDDRFEMSDERFEAMQRDMALGFQRIYRLMLQLGIGVGGSIAAALVGVIATRLF